MHLDADNEQSDCRAVHEVFTIGHSTLPLGAFVDLLRRYDFDLLVDIRRCPGSKHEPQFGQETLRQVLDAEGIGYAHLLALGGRRRARPDSPNGAWRNASFRGYADYMESADFHDGLEKLMALARFERVAIMCAEAVWWKCHRALGADALTAKQWQVWHIMRDGPLKPHRLTAPAHLVDGLVSYHVMSSAAEQSPDQPATLK